MKRFFLAAMLAAAVSCTQMSSGDIRLESMGVSASPSSGEISIDLEIVRTSPESKFVIISFKPDCARRATRIIALREDTTCVNYALTLDDDAAVWAPENPSMHTMKYLFNGSKNVTSFAIKELEASDGMLLINGQATFLKGIVADSPASAGEEFINTLSEYRNLGLNSILFSFTPDNGTLEASYRSGLLPLFPEDEVYSSIDLSFSSIENFKADNAFAKKMAGIICRKELASSKGGYFFRHHVLVSSDAAAEEKAVTLGETVICHEFREALSHLGSGKKVILITGKSLPAAVMENIPPACVLLSRTASQEGLVNSVIEGRCRRGAILIFSAAGLTTSAGSDELTAAFVEYMNSETFKPEASFTPEQLKQLAL